MTPYEAYDKAKKLGKKIPDLEPTICKDSWFSYRYAFDVIKGRWELAEPTISKDAYSSYGYARDVIEDRFILGEPAISQDAYYSYCYAIEVIKGRLPDFMHNQMILSNDKSAKKYLKFIK